MVSSGVVQNFQQLIPANNVVEVPHFQRNCSWELKQVEELFSDIEKTAQGNDIHFLGSLILLNDGQSAGLVQVIDGQQRFTTLFLLIALIRDKAASLNDSVIPGGSFGAPILVPQVAREAIPLTNWISLDANFRTNKSQRLTSGPLIVNTKLTLALTARASLIKRLERTI